MNFQSAFEMMKNGAAVALPEWGGYWRWDNDNKTIQIHCRDGSTLDMRESDDMDFPRLLV